MSQCHRLACSLIALALLPMEVHAGPAPGELTLEPYTFSSRSGETIEAVMGTLVVPYDRSNADSETIALKLVRFPATTDDPGPPLVYLAGGPGGSGIGAARGRRFELFMKLRELGDVIAWDQRGTGLSEPQVRIEASFDIPLEGAVSREWLEEQYVRVANEAKTQFERDGFNPAPLNTNASADDLEDLRIALGAEKLRLWTISYGTHLALATVKRHPNAIDSMVLAGVEGLDSSGEMDVRTPPANAEAVLKGSPNGHHVIISRAGHDNDLWISSPKIAECIIAFFQGRPVPYQRIELPPIEFMIPPWFIDE